MMFLRIEAVSIEGPLCRENRPPSEGPLLAAADRAAEAAAQVPSRSAGQIKKESVPGVPTKGIPQGDGLPFRVCPLGYIGGFAKLPVMRLCGVLPEVNPRTYVQGNLIRQPDVTLVYTSRSTLVHTFGPWSQRMPESQVFAGRSERLCEFLDRDAFRVLPLLGVCLLVLFRWRDVQSVLCKARAPRDRSILTSPCASSSSSILFVFCHARFSLEICAACRQ